MLWHRQAIFERRYVVIICWMQNSKLGSLRHQISDVEFRCFLLGNIDQQIFICVSKLLYTSSKQIDLRLQLLQKRVKNKTLLKIAPKKIICRKRHLNYHMQCSFIIVDLLLHCNKPNIAITGTSSGKSIFTEKHDILLWETYANLCRCHVYHGSNEYSFEIYRYTIVVLS